MLTLRVFIDLGTVRRLRRVRIDKRQIAIKQRPIESDRIAAIAWLDLSVTIYFGNRKPFLNVVDKPHQCSELNRCVFLFAGANDFNADAVVVSDTTQGAFFVDMNGGVFRVNRLVNFAVAVDDILRAWMAKTTVIPAFDDRFCIGDSRGFSRVNDQVLHLRLARANAATQRTVGENPRPNHIFRRVSPRHSALEVSPYARTELSIKRLRI